MCPWCCFMWANTNLASTSSDVTIKSIYSEAIRLNLQTLQFWPTYAAMTPLPSSTSRSASRLKSSFHDLITLKASTFIGQAELSNP